jgi:hypothetical protein
MRKAGTMGALQKSLTSWGRTDSVLIWVWALCAPAIVTAYEVFLNNESQHPGPKFWEDRVPGYFAVTLVFTGVTVGLSKLLPKGWLGVVIASIAISIVFPFLSPGYVDLWDRLQLARNLILLTTAFLVLPYLIASFMRSCGPPATIVAALVTAANYLFLYHFGPVAR